MIKFIRKYFQIYDISFFSSLNKKNTNDFIVLCDFINKGDNLIDNWSFTMKKITIIFGGISLVFFLLVLSCTNVPGLPSNNDINNGLLSGTTTLPSSSSSNIKNSAGSPEALYIYFEDGQSDINLKTVFDNEMISRGLVDANGDPDLTRFRAGASNYSFTGVHFVVPETFTVGSKTLGTAAITTGGRIEDDAGTEVTVVLDLEKSSMVAGHGGHGGDGGFTDIARTEAAQRLLYKGEVVVGDKNVTASTDGRNGTAAIYIDQTNISKLTIRIKLNLY